MREKKYSFLKQLLVITFLLTTLIGCGRTKFDASSPSIQSDGVSVSATVKRIGQPGDRLILELHTWDFGDLNGSYDSFLAYSDDTRLNRVELTLEEDRTYYDAVFLVNPPTIKTYLTTRVSLDASDEGEQRDVSFYTTTSSALGDESKVESLTEAFNEPKIQQEREYQEELAKEFEVQWNQADDAFYDDNHYEEALSIYDMLFENGLRDGQMLTNRAISYVEIFGLDENAYERYEIALEYMERDYPNDEVTSMLREMVDERNERIRAEREKLSGIDDSFYDISLNDGHFSATYEISFWTFDGAVQNTAEDIWDLLDQVPEITSLAINTVHEGENHYGEEKLFDYGVLRLDASDINEIRRYTSSTDYAYGSAMSVMPIITHFTVNDLPR